MAWNDLPPEAYQKTSSPKKWDEFAPDVQASNLAEDRAAMTHKMDPSLPGRYTEDGFEIKDEPAPIPEWARVAVKNFPGTPKDKLNFYKKYAPDLDVREHEGKIIAKRKQDKYFGVEDPSVDYTISNPMSGGLKEVAQDLGDIAWDIPAGMLQTAATTEGALATLPNPALGATAAAAASGAALDAINQTIAKAIGTRSEYDPTSMVESGTVGAVIPHVFGYGMSDRAIKNALNDLPKMDKFMRSQDLGPLPQGYHPSATVSDLFKQEMASKNKGVASKLWNAFNSIFFGTPESVSNAAVDEVPAWFRKKVTSSGVNLDVEGPLNYLELARNINAQNADKAPGIVSVDLVNDALNKQQKYFSERYIRPLEESGTKVSLPEMAAPLLDLKKELKANSNVRGAKDQVKEVNAILSKWFKVPDKTRVIVTPEGEQIIQKIPQKQEVGIKEAQRISQAIKDYSYGYLAQKGDTAVSQLLRNISNNVSENLNDFVYDEIGKLGDTRLRKDYAKYMQLSKSVVPKFEDPMTAAKTISNLTNKNANNRILLGDVKEFGQRYGVDFEPSIKLGVVSKYFGDPSIEAISTGGATSTSKYNRAADMGQSVGSLVGNLIPFPGSKTVLRDVGRTVGGSLGSNKVQAWKLGRAAWLKRSPNAQAFLGVPGKVLDTAPFSPAALWNYLHNTGD